MSSIYVQHAKHSGLWQKLLAQAAPDSEVYAWPAAIEPETVDYLVTWHPPENFYAEYRNLKAVFAMGAGIDGFLARKDLASDIPIIRLTDAGMSEQMVEYALLGVLNYQRQVLAYRTLQSQQHWRPLAPRLRSDVRVGVLGLGSIGMTVAGALAEFGYRVQGWSRTLKSAPKFACTHGLAALPSVLASSDVLINLLPSTAETRGLLNAERLALLPIGAYLVHCSRGDQLDADALLQALEQDHLSGALLDVFAQEPLPPGNPLWSHPKVTVTPHVAARTLPEASVLQIVEKLRALERGERVEGMVSRTSGY